VPWNILPLCHGVGGCNNAKGKKHPEAWLSERLGHTAAKRKLKEIHDYFSYIQYQKP
jgi:hypothetical protein